jgi:hypothetical protein
MQKEGNHSSSNACLIYVLHDLTIAYYEPNKSTTYYAITDIYSS